jgi:hypothetical protein
MIVTAETYQIITAIIAVVEIAFANMERSHQTPQTWLHLLRTYTEQQANNWMKTTW